MNERLTEKHIVDNIDCGYKVKKDTCEDGIIQGWNKTDAINKLGQLEDIEEELEIKISILNKARKNGIWVRLLDYTKPAFIKISFHVCDVDFDKHLLDVRRIFLYPNSPHALIGGHTYYFKDYGTTWALTKEELL